VDELVLRIGTRERLALEELARVDPGSRDAATIAEGALREGLAARLDAAGLASTYRDTPSEAGEWPPTEATRRDRSWSRPETRAIALGGGAVALLVVLVGGYAYGWAWTGFADNNQLWDWLHLLLLPVALGTFPLWLKYGRYMSRRRRFALASAVLAFAAFVAVGYLVPLEWTGFRGNTLWDWLTLLLLPLALVTVRMWPSTSREIHAGHIAFSSAVALALLVTLIGGYAGDWAWTGYPGNTLWDWLALVLGPVAVATFIVPAAVRWVSGDVERAAKEAKVPTLADSGR
jgi:hypothetical protein